MHDIRTDAPAPRTALVVGAGIGGLAAAVALRRLGLQVQILERASSLAPGGAGLTLWPNALRALDELGVGAMVRESARPISSSAILAPDGRVLTEAPLGAITARFGPVLALHRADLRHALLTAAGAELVTLGAIVIGAINQEDVAGVRLMDGSEHRADVVVAADGIGSIMRATVIDGEGRPRYAGATSWRGVAPLGLHEVGASETVGAGLRFGIVPLPDDRTYWFATATGARTVTSDGDHVRAGLLKRFAGWHKPICSLIEATDPVDIIATDLEELPQLGSWTSGRIALLGDAAHAMTPNLGQGAAMAIEDAVVLGRELGRGRRDVETALEAYNAARRPRVERIARESRRIGRVMQARRPAAVRARAWVLRVTPAAATQRRLTRVVDFE